jgi:aspartyl-tRNA(Asn)/glutamyl-tRNA(Gln) amidotransferase subunit A
LTAECLERIQQANGQLHAWTTLDAERAFREAERLTVEAQQGRWRSGIHGIPVGIKDIIDVFDLPTGCGSTLWSRSYAREDAAIVRRLRHAGAIILGKTVTTPYAYLDPPPTRNPWHPEHTPGGSSSGSAVAVAAQMAYAALGTQTGGSIIRPAAYCGICGFKPTFGRLPTQRILPLAPSLDHVGLLARTVQDLRLLFTTLCDRPPRYSSEQFTRGRPVLICLTDYLEDPRLESVMRHAFEHWQQAVEACDWKWRESLCPIPISMIRRNHATIMAVEAAAYHGERLQQHPQDYPPRITELVRNGLSHTGVEYQQAILHMRQSRRQIDAWFVRAGGVVVVPATTGPAPSRDTTGDPAFQSPWSYLGLPVVTFPIGRTPEGLPLGLQLVGPRHHDEWLLYVAEQLAAISPYANF